MTHRGKSGHRECSQEAVVQVQVRDGGDLDQSSTGEDREKLRSFLRSRKQVVWMWEMRMRMEPITVTGLRVRRNLQA